MKAAVQDRAAGTAERLIERGVDPEDLQAALLAAAFDQDMLPFVLKAADQQGISLDYRPALESAVRYAGPEVIELLRAHVSPTDLEDFDGIEQVRHLERTQWFHGPARRKAIRRICRLIRGGKVDSCLEAPMETGLLPLLEAARRGLDRVVDTLLERGANADVREPREGPLTGRTALMMAAELGRGAMVESLLRAGADPNRRSANGSTALILGANDPDMVRRLLAAGADVRAVTQTGRSAFQAAGGLFREEIQQLLRQAENAGRQEGSGSGVRWVRRPGLRREGAEAFLELFDDQPWSVIFVQAPIKNVTRVYSELCEPVRQELDVMDRDMTAAKEWAYLVQLRGHPETIILRALGRWTWGDRFRTGQEAMELSTFLSCRALGVTFNGQADHNGPAETQKCTYELYHDGELQEERRWHKDGEVLFRRPLKATAPDTFGTSWADLHAVLKQQGVFLPPAKTLLEGSRIYLELYGLEKLDLERIDLLVFQELD